MKVGDVVYHVHHKNGCGVRIVRNCTVRTPERWLLGTRQVRPPPCHPSPGSTSCPAGTGEGRGERRHPGSTCPRGRSSRLAPGRDGTASPATTAPCGSRRSIDGSVDGTWGEGLSGGAWDVALRLRGAGGSRGTMRTPAAAAAPRPRTRAASLPGEGKGDQFPRSVLDSTPYVDTAQCTIQWWLRGA